MTRILDLIFDQEIDAVTRHLDDQISQINAKAAATGNMGSSARLLWLLEAFRATVEDATQRIFGRAEACAERAELTIEEAREAGIARMRSYISDLSTKLEIMNSVRGSNMHSASRAIMARFADVLKQFDRSVEIYKAGMFGVTKSATPITPAQNVLNVTGTGHSVIAQIGAVQSAQTVHQTNLVDELSTAIDDAPLSKAARAEVEALVEDLKVEAAKPTKDRGRISGILDGISKLTGIAKNAASPELASAFHHVTGLLAHALS